MEKGYSSLLHLIDGLFIYELLHLGWDSGTHGSRARTDLDLGSRVRVQIGCSVKEKEK